MKSESTHRTFLLTWNPDQGRPEDLSEDAEATQGEGSFFHRRWATGARKDLPPGSRIFLLRQGVEPRGIVASGWSLTEPEKEVGGIYAEFVLSLAIDADEDDILLLSDIVADTKLAAVDWYPQGGGVEITKIADHLESLWKDLIDRSGLEELEFYDEYIPEYLSLLEENEDEEEDEEGEEDETLLVLDDEEKDAIAEHVFSRLNENLNVHLGDDTVGHIADAVMQRLLKKDFIEIVAEAAADSACDVIQDTLRKQGGKRGFSILGSRLTLADVLSYSSDYAEVLEDIQNKLKRIDEKLKGE